MKLDSDLQSIQEARDLSAKAKEAQLEYQHFNQEQVDKIIKAIKTDKGTYKFNERFVKLDDISKVGEIK